MSAARRFAFWGRRQKQTFFHRLPRWEYPKINEQWVRVIGDWEHSSRWGASSGVKTGSEQSYFMPVDSVIYRLDENKSRAALRMIDGIYFQLGPSECAASQPMLCVFSRLASKRE